MKKFIKKLITKQNLIKLLIALFAVYIIWMWYRYFPAINPSLEEQEKIKIDEYNFSQRDIFKKAVKKNPKEERVEFETLNKFNTFFDTDIKPMTRDNNCYYINSENWDEDYIFGFQLESKKYQRRYGTKHYAYPKYDLPENIMCDNVSCDDSNWWRYYRAISETCKTTVSGRVFHDENRNGIKDINEKWSGARRAFIDKNNDGLYYEYGREKWTKVKTWWYYEMTRLSEESLDMKLKLAVSDNIGVTFPENNIYIYQLAENELKTWFDFWITLEEWAKGNFVPKEVWEK